VGLLSGSGDDSINMPASRGAGSVAIHGKGLDKSVEVPCVSRNPIALQVSNTLGRAES